MDPIELLRREHELILSALGVLDAVARRLGRGAPPGRALHTLLDFFEHFADGCHHVKEEELLFPALSAAGLPFDQGPLAMMLAEHDEGRWLLALLRAALADLDSDDGRRYFRRLVDDYVGLLAQHIEKENQILFPLASELLSPRALAFDHDEAIDERDRWHQIVHQLVPPPA